MFALSEGDRLPYDLGISIALSRRVLWTAAEQALEANGFSMVEWVLLTFLARNGPSTQQRIAAAIGQHPAGVSRLLDALASRKLVRRRPDKVDRRRVQVELCAAGRAVFERGRPHVIGALREALAPLSTDEKKTLRALLGKIAPSPPTPKAAPSVPAAPSARRSRPRA